MLKNAKPPKLLWEFINSWSDMTELECKLNKMKFGYMLAPNVTVKRCDKNGYPNCNNR